MKAQEQLKDVGVIVIDVFSIKPLDETTIYACAKETGGKVLTVEDHYKEGGIHGICVLCEPDRCCMLSNGQVQRCGSAWISGDGGTKKWTARRIVGEVWH